MHAVRASAPWELIEYSGARAIVGLARRLPFDRARRGAAAVGRRVFDLAGRRVALTLSNLRIAYPALKEAERRRIGRASYVHAAWNLLDWARATSWGPENVMRRVEVIGLEHVHGALEAHHGVLVLSAHLGCFELAAKAVSAHHLPLTMVSQPLPNPWVDQWVVSERTRLGGQVIDRNHAAAAMLRALGANRVVAVFNDQSARRTRGVQVPLFGVECSTPAGLAVLAERSGAPVIPFFIHRDDADHHRAVFSPPLERSPAGRSRRHRVARATACYNQVIEEAIRAHPEQWIWAHRRFRKRDRGAGRRER